MNFLSHDNILTCKTKKSNGPWWEEIFKTQDDKDKPQLDFLPGSGTHPFYYNGRRIWLTHHEGEVLMVGHERKPTSQDKLIFRVMGTDVTPLKELIDDAITHSINKDEGLLCIYELHRWGIGWTKAQVKKPRKLDSVVLDKKMANLIKADITKFQNSMDWY